MKIYFDIELDNGTKVKREVKIKLNVSYNIGVKSVKITGYAMNKEE